MRVSFAGDGSNKFKVKGHEEDRDYLVMKVKEKRSLKMEWASMEKLKEEYQKILEISEQV